MKEKIFSASLHINNSDCYIDNITFLDITTFLEQQYNLKQENMLVYIIKTGLLIKWGSTEEYCILKEIK